MKKWIVLALVTCLSVVLIACGSAPSSNNANGPGPVIDVPEEDIATGEIEIVASNWKFDKEVYAIRAGEPVKMTVNSIDGIHGVEIRHTEYTHIGSNDEVEVLISEPGTYTIYCSIPCGQGHRTMKAKLVVVG